MTDPDSKVTVEQAAQAALEAWRALPEDERNGERPFIMGFNAGWEEAEAQSRPDPGVRELCERLKGLLAKATPGPWMVKNYPAIIRQNPMESEPPQLFIMEEGDEYPEGPSIIEDGFVTERAEHDAALIVEAVNALPTLLSALEAQAARLDEARRVIEPFAEHAKWQSKARGKVADLEGHSLLAEHFRAAAAFLATPSTAAEETDRG